MTEIIPKVFCPKGHLAQTQIRLGPPGSITKRTWHCPIPSCKDFYKEEVIYDESSQEAGPQLFSDVAGEVKQECNH